MYKTHTCGELNIKHVGQEVTLAGWVDRLRDLGGVSFIDLRDRFGIVQIVSNPETSPEVHQALTPVRTEWVIQAIGIVRKRPEGMKNLDLPTGEIEVELSRIEILNPAITPPFLINQEEDVEEQTRLKFGIWTCAVRGCGIISSCGTRSWLLSADIWIKRIFSRSKRRSC